MSSLVPSVGRISSALPTQFSDLSGFYTQISGSTWKANAVPATGHTLALTDSLIYAKQQAEALSIPSGSGIPYGWYASIIANATTLGTGSVAITPTGGRYP